MERVVSEEGDRSRGGRLEGKRPERGEERLEPRSNVLTLSFVVVMERVDQRSGVEQVLSLSLVMICI